MHMPLFIRHVSTLVVGHIGQMTVKLRRDTSVSKWPVSAAVRSSCKRQAHKCAAGGSLRTQ